MRLRRDRLLLAAAVLLVAGCKMEPDAPQLHADVRSWYPSQDIVIPVETHSHSASYAEYRYEYNAGEGWVVDIERAIRIRGESCLIEFTAADPDWDHRLTISILAQDGIGQPLEPYSTIERYFDIDTTAPSADPGILQLTTYYDPGPMSLWFSMDNPEYDAPSGSPINIYYLCVDPGNTSDPFVPNERSQRYKPDNPDDPHDSNEMIFVWGGGFPENDFFRIIVIDAAGNRSAVRNVQVLP